jgi:hypothetical protein
MWVAMGVSISIWRPTPSARSPAGRTVLFQVLAENRQFAVWHQDQLVKRLPIKGLVGQEMVLPDYLKSIRASSVGCSAAFLCPWGKTKSGSRLFGAGLLHSRE